MRLKTSNFYQRNRFPKHTIQNPNLHSYTYISFTKIKKNSHKIMHIIEIEICPNKLIQEIRMPQNYPNWFILKNVDISSVIHEIQTHSVKYKSSLEDHSNQKTPNITRTRFRRKFFIH